MNDYIAYPIFACIPLLLRHNTMPFWPFPHADLENINFVLNSFDVTWTPYLDYYLTFVRFVCWVDVWIDLIRLVLVMIHHVHHNMFYIYSTKYVYCIEYYRVIATKLEQRKIREYCESHDMWIYVFLSFSWSLIRLPNIPAAMSRVHLISSLADKLRVS